MIACVLSAQPVSSEKSLILFDEDVRHIDLAETTRATIQRNGGRVRAVIGVSGILADLTPAALHEIAAISGIRVYRGNDAADAARESDAETSLALTTWNRLREPASNTETGQRLSNDVQANPRRVAGRFQLNTLSAGYQQHWEQTRRTLPPRLQRSSGIGCGSNGADYLDTSLYLAGDVAVGVFYVPSANPWTPALTASTFADVVTALDEFIDIEPRARLTFTYVNEVNGTGNPLAKPPNEYDYVNDLRSTYCTDWAFLIDMSNGGPWPNADYWGPALRMDRTFGWFHDVLRHETAHVFGAWDGYAPNGAPNGRFGYLNGTQGNACGQGGGYFSGAGDCLADLMNGWDPVYGYNSRISVSTAGQLGWSSEGD
ncbi:MAG TPA: hypothetical protein VKB93_01245, partial [Thermoanaerobaculia bacterium]|nr:hypothetical protein [Thermoanaerobaculia bacterium]